MVRTGKEGAGRRCTHRRFRLDGADREGGAGRRCTRRRFRLEWRRQGRRGWEEMHTAALPVRWHRQGRRGWEEMQSGKQNMGTTGIGAAQPRKHCGIMGGQDRTTRLQRHFGPACRTQPGELNRWTVFCLKLGNRAISQAGPWTKRSDQRIKQSNYGTSLNGSHGYKGLMVKL